MNARALIGAIPTKIIDVVEPGRTTSSDHIVFALGRDVTFSTNALRSYAFANWESAIHDAMVVAAAIEYADRVVKRPSLGWPRQLSLRIPVHDPARWNSPEISDALHEAIGFLTGDYWSIDFRQVEVPASPPVQEYLNIPTATNAVLAFSEGMDSLAVARLFESQPGNKLVRVRIRKGTSDRRAANEPFTAVPYTVAANMPNRESSARSRGFKFAVIAAIAAYLTDATRMILPESGQGSLGPAIVPVGHAYPDYRNHPLFARRMERFVSALFGRSMRYEFPRLWHTKGETLAEFVRETGDQSWSSTRSCWRNSQWSSVNGGHRQCGVCAACMLRRLSVHAAGLVESDDTYICKDMTAPSLEKAVEPGFKRMSGAFREYAIAGVMHLDHLADLAKNEARPVLRRHANLLGPALDLTVDETERQLFELLNRHADEWKTYMRSLGPRSFAKQWSRAD